MWKTAKEKFCCAEQSYFENEYNNNYKISTAAAVGGVESVKNLFDSHKTAIFEIFFC